MNEVVNRVVVVFFMLVDESVCSCYNNPCCFFFLLDIYIWCSLFFCHVIMFVAGLLAIVFFSGWICSY